MGVMAWMRKFGQTSRVASAGAAYPRSARASAHGWTEFIVVFSGATLPAAYSCLKVGPVWPAGGAAERAELGLWLPGAVYTSTAGLYVLVHVRQRDRAAWERSWSPRSHPAHHPQ